MVILRFNIKNNINKTIYLLKKYITMDGVPGKTEMLEDVRKCAWQPASQG